MTLLSICVTTFVVCIAGAVIPLINTEVYLLAAVALSPRAYVAPLVVAATLGQMVGKVMMFYGGRGILRIRSERVQRGVGKVRALLARGPWTARVVLFSSATIGLPPLYVISVACGATNMGVVPFFLIGTTGRLIHFAVVAALPQYARLLLG